MSNIYARITQNQRASYKDIIIDQGSTYLDTVYLKNIDDTPFNLTDYNVRGKLRRSISSETAVDFTCTITNAANGVFTIGLTAAQTAALVAQNYMMTIYHYDIEIYDDSTLALQEVYRVLRGRAMIEPEVTR